MWETKKCLRIKNATTKWQLFHSSLFSLSSSAKNLIRNFWITFHDIRFFASWPLWPFANYGLEFLALPPSYLFYRRYTLNCPKKKKTFQPILRSNISAWGKILHLSLLRSKRKQRMKGGKKGTIGISSFSFVILSGIRYHELLVALIDWNSVNLTRKEEFLKEKVRHKKFTGSHLFSKSRLPLCF